MTRMLAQSDDSSVDLVGEIEEREVQVVDTGKDPTKRRGKR